MQIENHTIYNSELIGEAAKVLTRRYKYTIVVAECVLLGMAMYLVMTIGVQNSVMALGILAVGLILLAVVGIVRIGNYKKILGQRLRVVNNQDQVQCRYVFDEEKSLVETDSSTHTLYHKDIKKISETSKLYVVMYAGNVFIPVAKAGFADGGEAAFRRLLTLGSVKQ